MKQKLIILSSDDSLIDIYLEKLIDTNMPDDFCKSDSEDYYRSIILLDEIDELVWEKLYAENIDGIVSDYLSDYIPPIKGHYSLAELDIYKETEKRIRAQYDEVSISAFIDSVMIYEKKSSDFLVQCMNERQECESRDYDKGSAISRGIFEFVDKGKWQISLASYKGGGYRDSKPILWFGIEGKPPEEGWILDYQNPNWSDCWFTEDSNEMWENAVSDCDDIFLIWMTAECGIDLPDREAVLQRCPIEVNPNDDMKCLEEKVMAYFRSFSQRVVDGQ